MLRQPVPITVSAEELFPIAVRARQLARSSVSQGLAPKQLWQSNEAPDRIGGYNRNHDDSCFQRWTTLMRIRAIF